MKISKIEEAPEIPNPHKVSARKILEHDHVTVIYLNIKKGEALKKHITPVDVFFYVLEGRGLVEIGNEKKEVARDTLVESPAKVPHCWYNESEEALRILVVKVPRPTESTKLL